MALAAEANNVAASVPSNPSAITAIVDQYKFSQTCNVPQSALLGATICGWTLPPQVLNLYQQFLLASYADKQAFQVFAVTIMPSPESFFLSYNSLDVWMGVMKNDPKNPGHINLWALNVRI